MEVINCRSCGKLFNYFGGSHICAKCANLLEEKFKAVKEYIYEHPEAGVNVISQEMDVSVGTIHRWVREERLEFSPKSNFGLPCDGCGETIKIGRYCGKCRNDLKNRFSDLYKQKEFEKKQKGNSNPKMRFF